jgi:hypothetical protein
MGKMKLTGVIKNVTTDFLSGKTNITLEIDESQTLKQGYTSIQDIKLSIELKRWFKKRSMDSNSYSWVLMTEIAKEISKESPVTKDEIYLNMLKKYSKKCTYAILPNEKAVEELRQMYREVESLGEYTVTQKDGSERKCVQVCLYSGSSTFDTQEMKFFLDGVIEECKELGIETLTPRELELMNLKWKGGDKD